MQVRAQGKDTSSSSSAASSSAPLSNILPGKPAIHPTSPPLSPIAARLPSGPVLGKQLVDMGKRFKRLQNGSDVRGIAIDGETLMMDLQ